MEPPRKLTYDQLVEGMAPFVHFPEVENEMRVEKRTRVLEAESSVGFSPSSTGNVTDVLRVLDIQTTKEYKARLSLLLATCGGSLEALDRVCAVITPDTRTWAQRRRSPTATRTIAQFLLNPTDFDGVPWFTAERFRLPANWVDLMSSNIAAGVHQSLQSLYNTKTGFALETAIGSVVEVAGYSWAKGYVGFVDGREVDVAVPDVRLPRVLIMSSYNLTTASSQSRRVTAQRSMYDEIRAYNTVRAQFSDPDVQLINVLDGGGWLSRQSDLRQMHLHCDYAFAHSQLDQISDVLEYHMEL